MIYSNNRRLRDKVQDYNKLYCKTLRLFMVWLVISIATSGQAQEKNTDKGPKKGDMVISFSPSMTWIPEGAQQDNRNNEGHFAPGMGMDFFYRLSPKWEIGTMLDIEFAEYIIPRKNDLKRERAFVVTLMGAYTLSSRWNLFFGGGVELERHESFPVFRVGGEYVIPLKQEWFIPMGAFVDVKPGFHAWSLMIGIGKTF